MCVWITADNKAAVAAALGRLSTDEEQRDKHDIESDSVVMGIAIIVGFSITSCDSESVQRNLGSAWLRRDLCWLFWEQQHISKLRKQ